MRADAERSVRAILEAAEKVLSADPTASLEQIAETAGVARTTIHRRFSNRQALIDAMATTAVEQLEQAIEASRPETMPPLVALYRVTGNVLRTKINWRYALSPQATAAPSVLAGQDRIARRCLELLERAREHGLFDEATDLEWVRRVYYALIGEALRDRDDDPDLLATRVVETLLHGLAAR
jgi:AcrR family transcriptional regulator